MSKAAPVPIYSTVQQSPAPLSTYKRLMSSTSPGTTDSLATTCASQLLNATVILSPENGAQGGKNATAPIQVTDGWIIAAVSGYAPASAGITIDAGMWSFAIPCKRSNSFLASDNGMNLYAVLVKVDTTYSTNLGEVGRTAAVSFMIGVSMQTIVLTGSGVAVALAPGEALMLVVFCDVNLQLVGETYQFATNSTSGIRVTQAPPYSVQYVINHTESMPLAESHSRRVSYSRAQTETVPTPSELHQGSATYRRSQFEAVPPPVDAHKRVYMAVRGQSEAIPLTDLHARLVAYRRAQAEASSVTDIQSRQVTYVRVQAENLTSGGGQVVIAPVFNTFA